MKRTNAIFIATALVAFVLLAGPAATASDWGCKCILCMSNPAGATQYQECRPPIRKLEHHLSRGGRFPRCEGAEAGGYSIKQGYERYYSCQQAYGQGFQKATVETSNEKGFSYKKVCRKFIGHKTIDRPLKWRTNPHYVELRTPNGEKCGRVWYKKKCKKRRF
jgi:hypothetical protein